MIIPYQDKINELHASLKAYFKIEDNGYLNKYIGIEMYRRPDDSIHLGQPYLTQIIINIIPGVDKSITNPTPSVKPPLAKNEEYQARIITVIIDQ